VKSFTCIGVFLGAWLSTATATAAVSTPPDFARDVQPIFKKHCYECHGPQKQRNGYRLDRRSSAFGGLVRHNISPGNSESSRLYRRVLDSQFGPQMPIEDSLTDDEIATLKHWIDAGAHWPDELANEADLPPPDARAVALSALLRDYAHGRVNRRRVLDAISSAPAVVNARGNGGNTPLMEAAVYADGPVISAMLAAGGDPRIANHRGATALLWAVDDVAKARILLEHGANPNAASDFGQTPLTQAASLRDSAPVVKLLLKHGAEPTQAALTAAAGRANSRTLQMLLARLPDKGEAAHAALRSGCAECLELLGRSASALPRGLMMVLPVIRPGLPEDVHAALQRQPDVNVRDAKGRTPLMLASISETAPPELVQALVTRGASVQAKSKEGLTALDYALRLGRPEFIDALQRAGATPALTPPPPSSMAAIRDNDARAAIERSIPLLQRSGVTFFEKGGCLSCHHNYLGAKTTRMLRERGLPHDPVLEAREKRMLVEETLHSREQALQGFGVGGGLTLPVGYQMIALADFEQPADAATDALVRMIRRAQLADGHWSTANRPPSESSQFTATAVSLRALQLYGNPNDPADRRAVQLASTWLRKNLPRSTEDATFRLLGMVWAGAPASEIRTAAGSLLREQRGDGGWAQLTYRASDAYATGQVLVALREAGIADSPAYASGLRYLLDTQLEDGSWRVRTRSVFTQHYFESGFPHGIDQFISAAATHWALQALAGSLPEKTQRQKLASVQ
jgi:ankyrin repeat protein